MTALRGLVFVVIAVVWPWQSHGGTLQGRITDLFGAPREGITVQYEVSGRDPDTGEPYKIQGPQSFVTGATAPAKSGVFTLSIPDDRYRPNTKEVEIELTSRDLTPVTLRSLLGIATHSIQVVMPSLTVFEQRSLDLPLFALQGARGSFYLMDAHATAFYCSITSCKWHLAGLAFYDADAQFYYYRQTDEPDQRWAFSRNPNTYCICRGRRYIVVHGSTKVWLFSRGRWIVFDGARKVIPENGYNAKLGTITVGRRADQPPARPDGASKPSAPANLEERLSSSSVDLRVWTSRTGASRTSASLVEIDTGSGSVVLKKQSTAQSVAVPIRSLSASDQAYISRALVDQVVSE